VTPNHKRTLGTCPKCKRPMRVRQDGTVWRHGPHGKTCKGSGKQARWVAKVGEVVLKDYRQMHRLKEMGK